MSADEQEHPATGSVLNVTGLVSHRTREALVQLDLDGKVIAQMTTDQARNHALAVLDVAESAEQDQFMLEFALDELELSEQGAVLLLNTFRKAREKRTKP